MDKAVINTSNYFSFRWNVARIQGNKPEKTWEIVNVLKTAAWTIWRRDPSSDIQFIGREKFFR